MDRDESQALGGLIALFAITAAWWALALWPVADGPAWLARTRYVCFGVDGSGLPDAGGWIGLTLGPLGMLGILLVGWHRGVRRLLRCARSSRPVAATLTALVLGCLLMIAVQPYACSTPVPRPTGWTAADPVPPATYPRLDQPAHVLELTSQTGDVVDLADLVGQPVIVTFAFAHCTTICPLIVTHALNAQAELRGSDDEPAVLIVTLDPWRDPPSRLPAMAASWNLPPDGAWVLSGVVDDVEAVLDAWSVPRSRDTSTGEVTHPSLLYIIDRDGRIAFASTGGVDALVSLVRRL